MKPCEVRLERLPTGWDISVNGEVIKTLVFGREPEIAQLIAVNYAIGAARGIMAVWLAPVTLIINGKEFKL